jgi:hypothetical protein
VTVSGITWTGIDGSVWDLAGGSQGVQLSQGVSGLHLPSFKQVTAQASRVPGQRYLGSVYNARDVILPVVLGDPTGATTGAAWQALDDAWWQSLSPELPGTLTVTSSTGARSLQCRLGAAADPVFLTDPAASGVASYVLTLEADNPFWTGPDEVSTYSLPATATAQPYYGGSGGGGFGPPFYISAGSSLAAATVDNPGDRPAYAKFLFSGPGQPTFSIGSYTTTLPTLTDGQQVLIDTNPLAANAVVDVTGGGPSNFWPLMGAHDFWHAIPARTTGYPIPLSFAGGAYPDSTVTVTVTPLYNRAW